VQLRVRVSVDGVRVPIFSWALVAVKDPTEVGTLTLLAWASRQLKTLSSN